MVDFSTCFLFFQVCSWCFNRIKESDKPNCPKCRRTYGEVVTLKQEDLSEYLTEDELYEQPSYGTTVEGESGEDDYGSSSGTESTSYTSSPGRHHGGQAQSIATSKYADKSLLRNVRVVRRDLCYVVGIPLDVVQNDDTLKSFEYFGKYGKIVNIIVNRNPNFKSPDKRKSCAVYVTFSDKNEAVDAVVDLDNAVFDERRLRASYGTTKYCSAYLRNVRCNNRACFYLHERGKPEDSFTVDELSRVKEAGHGGLTCSTLLAEEFHDSKRWRTEESLFGMDRAAVVHYYCHTAQGKVRPVLASIQAEVDAARRKLAAPPPPKTSRLSIAAVSPPPNIEQVLHQLSQPPPPTMLEDLQSMGLVPRNDSFQQNVHYAIVDEPERPCIRFMDPTCVTSADKIARLLPLPSIQESHFAAAAASTIYRPSYTAQYA